VQPPLLSLQCHGSLNHYARLNTAHSHKRPATYLIIEYSPTKKAQKVPLWTDPVSIIFESFKRYIRLKLEQLCEWLITDPATDKRHSDVLKLIILRMLEQRVSINHIKKLKRSQFWMNTVVPTSFLLVLVTAHRTGVLAVFPYVSSTHISHATYKPTIRSYLRLPRRLICTSTGLNDVFQHATNL
jgi:hypothetical protein